MIPLNTPTIDCQAARSGRNREILPLNETYRFRGGPSCKKCAARAPCDAHASATNTTSWPYAQSMIWCVVARAAGEEARMSLSEAAELNASNTGCAHCQPKLRANCHDLAQKRRVIRLKVVQ